MEVSKKITIAIDGFSSCGKSTLAKAMSAALEYIFIDTGAMYRGIAWYAHEHGMIIDNTIDVQQIISALPNITITFGPKNRDGAHALLVNGKDVSEEIRSLTISSFVSEVAAIKEVRFQMVRQQQEMGKYGGVVLDGRDIGTIVFPNAELKLFLTATPEVRAKRRFLEMQSKGQSATLEEITANLAHRDWIDTTREEGPLKQAEDAILIDNSLLSEKEQFNHAMELAHNCLFATS